jgi:hypothetical protein
LFLVSCLRAVPSGFMEKISRSPSGLFTPVPVVRSLANAILPFAPGKVEACARPGASRLAASVANASNRSASTRVS